MVDESEFMISEEERERLVAEGIEEFPVEFPKYTTQLLNPANRFAQSTRDDVVGNMNELIEKFREEHPEGTFEDWVDFYFENYDGQKRINDATEKMYPMVRKMKDAFEEVDREMTQDFVRDLVLFKTYEGFDIQEAILRKLGEKFDEETRRATIIEERKGIDGFIGNQPVQVKAETYKDNLQDNIRVPIVYYDENKTNKGMMVDISELTEELEGDRWE
ncbi:MjaI family restriction endonuclease [Saliphagus infecundisoli]|uniref:MjaI family restriction endonuclease n=1 Tax=Saliphagus infecundisoli TaxID=1849069 RepID=A0ABD5QKH5_9EURY|nr:MjaI family restriction endonuclease [Saliphagus infecundisoli]